MASVESASNTGSGTGVFKQKTGTDLEFKTLTGVGGISALPFGADEISIGYHDVITAASTVVTADSTDIDASNFQEIPESNDGRNIGSGTGMFKDKDGTFLQFKSLAGGTNVTVTDASDTITIDASDATLASNVGVGTGTAGVFKQKVGDTLELRSLAPGSNVTLTQNSDTVTISSTDATSASNVGAGAGTAGVFKQKTGDDLEFRSLASGSNVTLTENPETVKIDFSDPTTASNIGSSAGSAGLFKQKVGDDLEFRSLVPGANITLTENADTISIGTIGSSNPWFNVLDYGAKNDDTDAPSTTAAFQAAIDAIQAQPGDLSGVLYIPAGTYNLNAQLVSTGKPITIQGDGYGVTYLKWSASPAGILINDLETHSTVRSVSFITTVSDAGTALDFQGAYSSGPVRSGVVISDVSMRGVHSASGYWTKGLRFSECPQSFVSNLQIDGRHAGVGAPGTGTTYGIEINSNNKATQYKIIGSNIFYCESAVKLTGNINSAEGIEIVSSDFVANKIGFDAFDMLGADTVGNLIVNCHFANIDYNIHGAITQAIITGNLFYDRAESTSSSAMVNIDDDGSATNQSIVISDNTFANAHGTAMQGVVISDNGKNAIVSGNIFQMTNANATAIWFKSGSSNCIAKDNKFVGDVTPYVNQGATSAIGVRSCLAYLSSDQSFDGTIEVAFNLTSYDSDGFFVGNGTIRIPSGRAVKRVRVSAAAFVSAFSGGSLIAAILFNNNANYVGMGGDFAYIHNEGGPANIRFSMETAILDVSDGDEFKLRLSENAGGSRTVFSNTWMMIEVIE